MPNIKPISDLRNYSNVLDNVKAGSPVYLTKNGRGSFVIMDIDEQEAQEEKAGKYESMKAQLKLMCELNAGKKSGEEKGWISEEDVFAHFRMKAND